MFALDRLNCFPNYGIALSKTAELPLYGWEANPWVGGFTNLKGIKVDA